MALIADDASSLVQLLQKSMEDLDGAWEVQDVYAGKDVTEELRKAWKSFEANLESKKDRRAKRKW